MRAATGRQLRTADTVGTTAPTAPQELTAPHALRKAACPGRPARLVPL
ncbi:hypothetical protein ACWD4L_14740 [Streptomyces sp. NPDC002596]